MGRSLYVSVTIEQGKQLKELAREKGASTSELVRRAVERYLRKMAKDTSYDARRDEPGFRE